MNSISSLKHFKKLSEKQTNVFIRNLNLNILTVNDNISIFKSMMRQLCPGK